MVLEIDLNNLMEHHKTEIATLNLGDKMSFIEIFTPLNLLNARWGIEPESSSPSSPSSISSSSDSSHSSNDNSDYSNSNSLDSNPLDLNKSPVHPNSQSSLVPLRGSNYSFTESLQGD